MSKNNITYLFFLSLINLFLSSSLFAQDISDFDISYPYSKDANSLFVNDLDYIWFYDYDDLYMFNGPQIKPLGLPTLAAKNKFDYKLQGLINLDNDQYLLSINKQFLVD